MDRVSSNKKPMLFVVKRQVIDWSLITREPKVVCDEKMNKQYECVKKTYGVILITKGWSAYKSDTHGETSSPIRY